MKRALREWMGAAAICGLLWLVLVVVLGIGR
jgi:hypothetical protein